jgi:hypothetical protein
MRAIKAERQGKVDGEYFYSDGEDDFEIVEGVIEDDGIE